MAQATKPARKKTPVKQKATKPDPAAAAKILRSGLSAGKRAFDGAPDRSTGARRQYKIAHDAAIDALEALGEKAPRGVTKAAPRKPRSRKK